MENTEQSIASHFFAIQELLLLVLSYISPPGKGTISSIDTDTLATLARVSRNISNAALDALWRSLHQPDAIIRLLPADAYAYEAVHNDDWEEVSDPRTGRDMAFPAASQYRLKRPLTADDFVIFDKYAPRIQYVDFSNSSKILGPGCELFPYIKEFRNPILPALVDFRWEPSVRNGSIGAFHLLSREASLPSEEFSLLMWSEIEHTTDESVTNESDAIARTIDAFNDPALPWLPDVKKLTLRTLHYLPAIEGAIQTLSNLEHFSCDLRVSDALFEHLAALPRLRFLDLRWLPTMIVSGSSPDAKTGSSFPVLEGLRISGTLPSIAALLPLISSPHLLSVRLIAKDLTSPANALSSYLSSIFSLLLPPSVPVRTSTAGLAHFTFTAPSSNRSGVEGANTAVIAGGGGGPVPPLLPLAAFSPLCTCAGIQTFRVDVDPVHVAVTDADVRAMAHAWPLLTTLTIAPPRARRTAAPGVELYALWALARRCPRLRTLAIEVDARVEEAFHVDGVEKGGAPTTSGHAVVMDELTLYSSPCGNPLVVADFLNRAFPRLPQRVFHVYSADGREKWDAVTQALAYVE
ncbi:hypothetical protein MVEN_02369500 [Mycena venus]|uniref:F-box domain-containing protein n=1 Tax=Mycena venus TaxID=2733690 RepID=A0A8H6X3K1_9AGAR|nr:hypothetical protein MVEN_02369500 [Mycena venus]